VLHKTPPISIITAWCKINTYKNSEDTSKNEITAIYVKLFLMFQGSVSVTNANTLQAVATSMLWPVKLENLLVASHKLTNG